MVKVGDWVKYHWKTSAFEIGEVVRVEDTGALAVTHRGSYILLRVETILEVRQEGQR
jgi:hypothetical protein